MRFSGRQGHTLLMLRFFYFVCFSNICTLVLVFFSSILEVMLTLRTRIITTIAMMIGKEQKRYASLTMETLNPRVKEVEYAVRGRNYNFFLILITISGCFLLLHIRSNCYSCWRYRKSVEGNYIMLDFYCSIIIFFR